MKHCFCGVSATDLRLREHTLGACIADQCGMAITERRQTHMYV
jgi:hypothetical protein